MSLPFPSMAGNGRLGQWVAAGLGRAWGRRRVGVGGARCGGVGTVGGSVGGGDGHTRNHGNIHSVARTVKLGRGSVAVAVVVVVVVVAVVAVGVAATRHRCWRGLYCLSQWCEAGVGYREGTCHQQRAL